MNRSYLATLALIVLLLVAAYLMPTTLFAIAIAVVALLIVWFVGKAVTK